MSSPPRAPDRQAAVATALAGLLCLATAMGIGRFAFTPLLPMMLADGVVDLRGASTLATANYVGYWLGALACALQPWLWRRLGRSQPLLQTRAIRIGLVATLLLTAGMALPWPAAWPWWRFMAGLASALVFVYTSGWCLARLTSLGSPALAGVIYVGPGLGISVSGLAASAMVAHGWLAWQGWLAMAALAVLLMALVWPRLHGSVGVTGGVAQADAPTRRGALAAFALAYGLAGYGYIVTATFLPVIARQALPGSVWLDLFWPLFGLGVSVGALLTLRLPMHWDRRHLLAGCYAMQALGVALSVVLPTLAGFALGSLLLGLPFTAITLFALQEARRLRPHGAAAFIGLLTASYGLGQIAGPLLVAAVLARSATPHEGFTVSLMSAAGALLAGLAIYLVLARRRPA
ncbi:YbfB/YjiJ family MFS transporter [Leptothrix discophora]|uniref:YbfB/YjiJ family MFS transporter n=1 Tax=Leptothrix discophora TaxID=89 RepID=A0ABT9G8A9_LEPDI|nr:YbfB/YjiJ family MFS transporter [Leptothrix discophora]MDP4302708.1 YbfB/YjiJ family MFS transporter [Leptothrix discophora]